MIALAYVFGVVSGICITVVAGLCFEYRARKIRKAEEDKFWPRMQ